MIANVKKVFLLELLKINMSSFWKVGAPIIIIVIAVIWYVASMSNPPSPSPVSEVSSEENATASYGAEENTAAAIYSRDSSDGSLDKDAAAIDSSLMSAQQDSSSVDEGMNDSQILEAE